MIETLKQQGITYRRVPPFPAAVRRWVVASRAELSAKILDLVQLLPEDMVAGPPFCAFNFVSSVSTGFDVEIGVPVSRAVDIRGVAVRTVNAMDVVSMVHAEDSDTLPRTSSKLFNAVGELGMISDEFYREVYHGGSALGPEIEVQFVVHNWSELMALNLDRVLGSAARKELLNTAGKLPVEAGPDARFLWAKTVIHALKSRVDDDDVYDVVSGCAHVFPAGQIEKLRMVFDTSMAETGRFLSAVDSVIEFMAGDPGWGEGAERVGNTVYSAKKPRDPEGFADAVTPEEKLRAYCFCPVIRDRLNQGMPVEFCYCGSGWYRQQWEGATGRPVRVEIVSSLLKGDPECRFAIHLNHDG